MTRTLRHALTLAVLAVLPSVLTAGPFRDRVQERRAERRLAAVGQCDRPATAVCAGPTATHPQVTAATFAQPMAAPVPAEAVPSILANCPNGKCPLRK